ncbi:MAG: hypothetical protein NZ890_00610 [Myxococcota bacterium]|nr:hypothetical protein [Myxococcota bacterium]
MGQLDIAFKELARTSLVEILRWLMPGIRLESLAELPQELPATLRHVDLLVRTVAEGARAELVVLECQAQRDPQLHPNMLLRAALAHVHHGLPVRTLVLALTEEAALEEEYVYGRHRQGVLSHRVEVRRLYEEEADPVVQSGPEALLPLVPVMKPRDGDRRRLLTQVVARIAELPVSPERKKLYLGWAATFATLTLSRAQVRAIVEDAARRRHFMLNALQDLPLLRDTYQEGLEKGLEEGMKRGLEKGLEKGLEGLRASLMLVYENRFGSAPPFVHEALCKLTDLSQLQALFPLFLSGTSAEIREHLSR